LKQDLTKRTAGHFACGIFKHFLVVEIIETLLRVFLALEHCPRPPTRPLMQTVWRTVNRVTPEEWQFIQSELRTNYNRILNLIKTAPAWSSEDEIGNAIAVVVHTAYHLGEIRQALCILRS
jgi:hypothetical protein